MPDNLKRRRDKFRTAAKQTAAPAEAGAKRRGRGRVSRAVKTQFSVQFATLQDAGMPVLRSLKILEGQTAPGRFKDVLGEISEDVEGGSPLSESFAKHPKVFDDLYVNIVKAGEAGGMLTQVFQRLADFMERSDRMIRRVKGALAYPLFVTLFAIGVVTFIMIVVIPQFEEIFSGLKSDLPKLTQLLIGASRWLGSVGWWMIPLLVLALVGAWKLVRRTPKGRLSTDRLKFRVPLFGQLMRKTQVARFARTLGTLSSSGVPLLDSLDIVRGTSTNAVMEFAVDDIKSSVSEGENLAPPMGESGIFDDMVVNMVDVGEETGELDRMLMKVADRYDEEVDNTVTTLLSVLEPALIVVMGIIVGVIVIALFLPMLEIQDQLR